MIRYSALESIFTLFYVDFQFKKEEEQIAFGLVCSLAERETKVEKSQLAFFQSINFKARLFRLVERERRVAPDQINLKITHTQNQQFDVSGGVWWG